jgi:hypothetical protein
MAADMGRCWERCYLPRQINGGHVGRELRMQALDIP